MGMTAIDAATQAKRLGASEVTLIYRRSAKEKPCTDNELKIARLDGCRVMWLTSPKEVTGKNGKITGIICDIMKLGDPDSSGRRAPVPTGETIFLDVDMVIKATGQIPREELIRNSGLNHVNGLITAGKKGETNIPGIFAGGDAVNGGKEVVNAVQAGKEAAESILEYLGV
jgi:glutamate synthase (NADPH/NADH) small chain